MGNSYNYLKMIRLFFRLLFEMIVNYFRLNKDIEHNFYIIQKICKKIVKAGKIDLNIQKKEEIPSQERFLIVSNHRCFFDVVFLIATIDRPISFVAAKELWSYPILRRYLDAIDCMALDRYAEDLKQLKNNIKRMKDAIMSRNIVLFPEGECSYYSTEMKPFKKGGFMGIVQLDIRIVPVFLEIGSMHSIGRWMIPDKEVNIFVGESFVPKDVNSENLKAAELARYAQEKVSDLRK